MAEVTKGDLLDVRDEIIRQMSDQFDGTHRRLDGLNGRVRKAEEHIVRLQERTRQSAGGVAAVWGGSVGGAFVAVIETVKWWFSK